MKHETNFYKEISRVLNTHCWLSLGQGSSFPKKSKLFHSSKPPACLGNFLCDERPTWNCSISSLQGEIEVILQYISSFYICVCVCACFFFLFSWETANLGVRNCRFSLVDCWLLLLLHHQPTWAGLHCYQESAFMHIPLNLIMKFHIYINNAIDSTVKILYILCYKNT